MGSIRIVDEAEQEVNRKKKEESEKKKPEEINYR